MSSGFDDVPTTAQRRPSRAAPPAGFALRVVEGPDEGRHFAGLHAGARALLGTSASCEVRLSDRRVSRRHAALAPFEDGVRVIDEESTNGTFIQRVRIRDAVLTEGELLAVGGTLLRLERDATAREPPVSPRTSFGRVVGASLRMRHLYALAERVAASVVSVLIEGETGTGKEALAEALHEAGPRASGPFVVLDCTAVPPTLLESELFGHERGAFTGAATMRKGLFELADGGTLLIDELGDLSLEMQPKLLRALERQEIRRVGGAQTIALDVRVIAATRRNLDREVQEGRFRDDLYHRIAVARLELPPLRDREGDVPVLVDHFCRSLGRDAGEVPADIMDRWQRAPWPGNVRELRNTVARQMALGDMADFTGPMSRPPPAASGGSAGGTVGGSVQGRVDAVLAERLPLAAARQKVIEAFERAYVERALAEHGGNVVQAARASGIARRYFQILKARTRGG